MLWRFRRCRHHVCTHSDGLIERIRFIIGFQKFPFFFFFLFNTFTDCFCWKSAMIHRRNYFTHNWYRERSTIDPHALSTTVNFRRSHDTVTIGITKRLDWISGFPPTAVCPPGMFFFFFFFRNSSIKYVRAHTPHSCAQTCVLCVSIMVRVCVRLREIGERYTRVKYSAF